MAQLTDALALIGHADGAAQKTGGPPQVAGAGVNDAVVAAQVLLRVGDLGADAVAGHTVGVVGLVYHTGGAARAKHVTTRLCPGQREGRCKTAARIRA